MSERKKEFSKIYDRQINKIYRFVFLKVNSKEKAEDITSETFTKAWSVFKDEEKQIDNISAFLYRVAKNLIIDFYRTKNQVLIVPVEEVPIIDHSQDIEQASIDKSDMRGIKVALADLSQDYQDVIIWYYLEDLPIAKVAELSGRTESATRVLIHRALSSLKDKLHTS